MGLIFDIDKDKTISMAVETSGIEDTSKLDFTFNITVEGIKYGFPCKLDEGRVKIKIPALKEVIKKVKSGKYKASLDVTGDKNYFLQPYNEEVELRQEPKVGVIVDKEDNKDMSEAISATISAIMEESNPVVTDTKNTNTINTNDKKKKKVKAGDDKPSIVSKMFNN